MLTLFLVAPILATHISMFFVNIAMVIVADVSALLWVLGKKEVLNKRLMHWLHRLIGVGLAISITTGAIMFWDVRDYLLTLPSFYTKLIFVLALVVNAFVIGKHFHVATERPFRELTKKERMPLFISGAVSTCAWVGVYIAARSLGM